MRKELATFGMGCFWGVELMFSKIPGVISTSVGYMGGDPNMKDVTYEQVCTDRTGYAEVVQVVYNSEKVKYEDLLNVFWKNHDPTSLNRQGPDVGTQYRSAIFYHNEKQKKAAENSKREYQKKTTNKIVTQVVEAGPYYMAEDYHQKYLEKAGLTSCHINY